MRKDGFKTLIFTRHIEGGKQGSIYLMSLSKYLKEQGRIANIPTLLRTIKDRNLWRASTAHTLKL